MSEAGGGAADRLPLAAMTGVIATVTVFAVAQGLTYPLLSLILERQGTSPLLIGLSAAMTPLGFIASSPLIPPLARRFALGPFVVACALLAGLSLVAIGVTGNVWAWMPLRFALGLFANPLYVLSETILIAITPSTRRGRVMGVYTSIISCGFALGPLALGLVGTVGWPPFGIGVAAFLACGLILFRVAPRLPRLPTEGDAVPVRRFIAGAPLLLSAVFAAAVFEQAVLALLPVYGAAFGSSEARITALIGVFIAGNAALQIVLGRASERFGAAGAMIACAAGALAGCLLLGTAFAGWPVWPLMFVWGGVTFGLYTTALIELGERFTGQSLIAGNASFSLVWGVGGILGSPTTGLVMQGIGPAGFTLSLGLLAVALMLALGLRRR